MIQRVSSIPACEVLGGSKKYRGLKLVRVKLFEYLKSVEVCISLRSSSRIQKVSGVAAYEATLQGLEEFRAFQLVELPEDKKSVEDCVRTQECEVARHRVASKWFVRGDEEAHFPALFGVSSAMHRFLREEWPLLVCCCCWCAGVECKRRVFFVSRP